MDKNMKKDKFNLKEELRNIENAFKVVGKLDNYQKRMLVQVFIDINNQFEELQRRLKEEINEWSIRVPLNEINFERIIDELFGFSGGEDES